LRPPLSFGNKTRGTPTRVGYLPVSKAARDGEQTQSAEQKFVNLIPSDAIRSRFGVGMCDP
jgi:hypothetical protein